MPAVQAPVVESSGARIPLIGLGTWDLRGKSCARMVEQALGLGYRHIDTAAMYRNEDQVGAWTPVAPHRPTCVATRPIGQCKTSGSPGGRGVAR